MGENRIKLVAADMDGTLLNRERKITKYTQNVIKKSNGTRCLFRSGYRKSCECITARVKRDGRNSLWDFQ
ncbi:MAG: HAD hydrolase family protein [Anaerostipes hadrus]